LYEDVNGEVNLIVMESGGERFIVLPEQWRESDQSFYFAEEDIDPARIDVYEEADTGRRYILDKNTDRKYFLVAASSIVRLAQVLNNKNLSLSGTERVRDSSHVVHLKHDAAEVGDELADVHGQLEVDYVEEYELEGVELGQFEIETDVETGEISLVNSHDRRQQFIVLPDGWRIAENLPYINEQDISLVELDFYVDARTRRKYVIDDKTGQRYYIVPDERDSFKRFVEANGLIKPVRSSNAEDAAAAAASGERQLKSALKKPKDSAAADSPSVAQRKKPATVAVGDQVLKEFESEPSNAGLRNMARLRPRDTVFNPPAKTPVAGKPEPPPPPPAPPIHHTKPTVAALFKPAPVFNNNNNNYNPSSNKTSSNKPQGNIYLYPPFKQLAFFGYVSD
jgi:hypothetical protein